jgi:hypothetical protein
VRDRNLLVYAVFAVSIAVILVGGVVLVREWTSNDDADGDTPPVVLTVIAGLENAEE